MTHYRSPRQNDGQWVHHDVAAQVLGMSTTRLNHLIRTGQGPDYRQEEPRAPRMYHMDELRRWIATRRVA